MSITYQKNMINLLRYSSFGPSLNLVSGGELQNETNVNFTRNTERHYWGQDGLVKTAAVDTLPTSYDPATGNKDGWPIMGQWTNEILDPRDMTTGNWDGSATVTRNQVGIDGESNTACLIEDNDSGAASFKSYKKTIPDNSSTHTASVIINKDEDESRFPEIGVNYELGTSELDYRIQINTSTGAIGTRSDGASADVDVQDLGDKWLVSVSAANNSSGNTQMELIIFPAIASSLGGVDASATGSIVVGYTGVFLNRSTPPPTPVYGETAGQSYTQDPDIATVTDLDAIGYNQDEGTIIVNFQEPSGFVNFQSIIQIDDGTRDNRIYMVLNSSGEIQFAITKDGINEYSEIISLGLGLNKAAIAYKDNDVSAALNGSIVSSSSSLSVPKSLSAVRIGHVVGQVNFLDSEILDIPYYPRRLTNAQLQQLTS